MEILYIIMLIISSNLLFLFSKFGNATDTLPSFHSMNDDSKTLVSQEGSFKLGFFSPGNSNNRYLGIWYGNIPVKTVVWVANRFLPIQDSSGLLILDNITSNLLLLGTNKTVVWSTNLNRQVKNATLVLLLLDSGNLVLRDEKDDSPENFFWQSFDYPTDTFLPGMKFGWDLEKGINRRFSAWKSSDDPSPGDLTWRLEPYSYPEGVMWKGSTKYHRGGPWNGLTDSGDAPLTRNEFVESLFVSNGKETYYIYNFKNKSTIQRVVLNQSVYSRQNYAWNQESETWRMFSPVPADNCDTYNLCGPYGNCVANVSPNCKCLNGFRPNSSVNWNSGDWSQGCVRNNPLKCHNGEGFVQFSGLKLPDTANSWVNSSLNIKECRAKCLENCSCMAYTNSDITGGGKGCAIWFGDLIDMRQSQFGERIYVRMSASDLETKGGGKLNIIIVIATAITAGFGVVIISYCIYRMKAWLRGKTGKKKNDKGHEQEDELELPLFDLTTIAKATNNFSINNKLGEGGFGPVYKGTLVDGQEIAVKRLSKSSGQGLQEFKNELILIAKLQHRNLVKLLGCCIQGDETMLVYEYMSNKSLDYFIFDEARSKQFDWSLRYNIVCGIARGLLYLHQDSRLRIIHRDLKPSNVLLDKEMNPKISDFGLAKTFGGDETYGNTNRVIGTYGYMVPEYATDGLFSVKSDVFSFGILMLEIISGKKSRGFYHPNHNLNLVGYAWRLWKEGNVLELIDSEMGESCNLSQAMRFIHISLLCIQQHADDRPIMASVVLMLSSDIKLPQPKEPGFFKNKGPLEEESSLSLVESSSANEVSASLLECR